MSDEPLLSRNDPVGLPLFLGFLGLVNLVVAGRYFLLSWSTLHSQGIGQLYLGLASVLGGWWLVWVAAVCFAGIAVFASPRSGAGTRRIVFTGLGLIVGYYAPQYLLALFFVVAVWVRSLL